MTFSLYSRRDHIFYLNQICSVPTMRNLLYNTEIGKHFPRDTPQEKQLLAAQIAENGSDLDVVLHQEPIAFFENTATETVSET